MVMVGPAQIAGFLALSGAAAAIALTDGPGAAAARSPAGLPLLSVAWSGTAADYYACLDMTGYGPGMSPAEKADVESGCRRSVFGTP